MLAEQNNEHERFVFNTALSVKVRRPDLLLIDPACSLEPVDSTPESPPYALGQLAFQLSELLQVWR